MNEQYVSTKYFDDSKIYDVFSNEWEKFMNNDFLKVIMRDFTKLIIESNEQNSLESNLSNRSMLSN